VDPASLAAFLAPFLPSLLRGAQELAEEAVPKLGEAAWKQARALWAQLRPRVEAKEQAQAAAGVLAEMPDDARARGGFALQLELLLKNDEQLAADLKTLWEQGPAPSIVIASGDQAVAVGRDNLGSINTGTITTQPD
jgi:hypothetical protein